MPIVSYILECFLVLVTLAYDFMLRIYTLYNRISFVNKVYILSMFASCYPCFHVVIVLSSNLPFFFFVKNHMDSKSFFFRMVWLYLEWFLSSLHTFMDKGSSNNVCRTCAASLQSFTPFGCIVSIWQIKKDKEFLSFISGKWNEIRHLVFWSLETLTGLKDQVRRLVA
jgi:hypothetical protein